MEGVEGKQGEGRGALAADPGGKACLNTGGDHKRINSKSIPGNV